MFRIIVKHLYIGKSKLIISINGKTMPPETLVRDIALPTSDVGLYHPDYGTIGFLDFTPDGPVYRVTPQGNTKLFITGIPKTESSLNPFRLQGCIWSSYYEDNHRGYLFQILPSNEPFKLFEK